MHKSAGHQLDGKYNFVGRTVTSIDDESREREHQRDEGEIIGFDSANADRYSYVIKGKSTVHEKRANHHQFSSEIRVHYHDLSIFRVRDVPPIPLDPFHAFPDIGFVEN